MIWLVIIGSWVAAWLLTLGLSLGYRFYKPGSTIDDVVGPARLPWWAAYTMIPLAILAFLAWALAAGVRAPRVAKVASRVALGAVVGFFGAWAAGWGTTLGVSFMFPPWPRYPVPTTEKV